MLKLSPTGTRFAFLEEQEGRSVIKVCATDEPAADLATVAQQGTYITRFEWSGCGTYLCYEHEVAGNDEFAVSVYDLSRARYRRLSPEDSVHAEITAIGTGRSSEIILSHNARAQRYLDPFRVGLSSGKPMPVLTNDRFRKIYFDRSMTPRLALESHPDGALLLMARDGDGWQQTGRIEPGHRLSFSVSGISPCGNFAYLRDPRWQDFVSVSRLDLRTGSVDIIYHPEKSDVHEVWLDRETGEPIAVCEDNGRARWLGLNTAARDLLAHLHAELGGDPIPISQSVDGRTWIITERTDTSPERPFFFDAERGSLRPVFADDGGRRTHGYRPMHIERIASRDGLELVTYITRPDEARGAPPFPCIIHIHGGPWAREHWGFNPLHQWLANRGYLVLSVNYRGSTGFGQSFLERGFREWGRAMQDDIADVALWAIENGHAEAGRIGIYGGSYGGYAALMGLAREPDLYACAVSKAAPTDLVSMLETMPEHWKSGASVLSKMVGDAACPDGRIQLLNQSPITHATALEKPLLFTVGGLDTRVRRADADLFAGVAFEANRALTYVVFSEAGHRFQKSRDRLALHALTEHFFSQILGGACEPLDGVVDASSAVFKHAATPFSESDAAERQADG